MLVIKIQSWSDVITNSSSEIFCSAANVDLLKDFIKSILQLSDPNIDIDNLIKITAILDIDVIKEFIMDEDVDVLQKLKDLRIDKKYLLNALDFSTNQNLLPVETFLRQLGYNYEDLSEHLKDVKHEQLSIDYTITSIDKRIDSNTIDRINSILTNFPTRLYNIAERFDY